jgi:hypothetical protein
MYINIYNIKIHLRILPKNSMHNPNFEVYMQNFKFCDGYYHAYVPYI